MKFVKYNDNKSVTIPPAVLTVCGLDDEGKLEMAGAKGAVILSKSEMTAMEMVRTILALTDRAGQLMRELTGLCGSCEGCTEGHCTFRDADIEELIRPAVTVPDWAREEADIAPDAKLDCHVDEGSGAGHEDLTGEYSAITEELRAVCRVFGKEVLREVPEADFLAELPHVRKAAGDRAVNRAFHVYGENRRVREEVQALRSGDFQRFLTLVRESGRSSAMYLQNIIPTGSTAAQELMVTIALCERILDGQGAVRVHGGGFGGTAQAFVPLDMLDGFRDRVEASLGRGCCHVVRIRPAGGIRLG